MTSLFLICRGIFRRTRSNQKIWLPLVTIVCSLRGSLSRGQAIDIGDDVSHPILRAGHDYIQMLNETVNPANDPGRRFIFSAAQLFTPNNEGARMFLFLANSSVIPRQNTNS